MTVRLSGSWSPLRPSKGGRPWPRLARPTRVVALAMGRPEQSQEALEANAEHPLVESLHFPEAVRGPARLVVRGRSRGFHLGCNTWGGLVPKEP